MRLSTSLLVPFLAGAARAATQGSAAAYILQETALPESFAPSLSAEDARLVLAQRLGISQYHDITKASDDTLYHINALGSQPQRLLSSSVELPKQLVVFMTDISDDVMAGLARARKTPSFTVADIPDRKTTARLVKDLAAQLAPSAPSCSLSQLLDVDSQCWSGNAYILQLDANVIDSSYDATDDFNKLSKLASEGIVETTVLFTAGGSSKSYGDYEMPSKRQISRKRQEEPITEAKPPTSAPVGQSAKAAVAPLTPPPICYNSSDSCVSMTGNCSGHGSCYLKYGSCYACRCEPTVHVGENGLVNSAYWAGSTCAKKDISAPFWLITLFTITIVAVIGSSIGLLYSVGQEPLPGVIGAGVAGPKAR